MWDLFDCSAQQWLESMPLNREDYPKTSAPFVCFSMINEYVCIKFFQRFSNSASIPVQYCLCKILSAITQAFYNSCNEFAPVVSAQFIGSIFPYRYIP
jgi:hypothetical protein